MAQDLKYREFLALLKRREMNLTKLAIVVFGKVETATGSGKFRPIGRASLNLVLLGRRPGSPTWEKLRNALTKAEWDVIYPYAQAKYAALLAEGKVKASEFVAKAVAAQEACFADGRTTGLGNGST